MRALRSPLGLVWPCLGLLASCAVSVSATKLLAQSPIPWWWHVALPGGHGFALVVFWTGVGLLSVAWLGVARTIRSTTIRPRHVLALAAVWAVPLALGPALFSLDMYSYFAQGTLLHDGVNPYHAAPALLPGGDAHVLSVVSPFWRHTTAPYGPLFLLLASGAAALAGGHIVLGIMLLRLIELAGVGLLALATPSLARSLGADPSVAIWLVVASPLTLLYLIGGGHNDALMAGLLVAGVALAARHRWLAAIAVCSLAATVKLPALAAVAMIGVCWWRVTPERRVQTVASVAVVCAGVLLLAGVFAGVGVSWASSGLFSTPGAVRLAITPATAVGVTLSDLLHALGIGAQAKLEIGAQAKSIEVDAVRITSGVVLLGGLWLCLRVSAETLVPYLGAFLLAAAIGGPAAWPWYLIWGAALLAAHPRAQRSPWLAALLIAGAVLIDPGGQVWIPRPDAPVMLGIYAALAALAAVVMLRARRVRRPGARELSAATARAAG